MQSYAKEDDESTVTDPSDDDLDFVEGQVHRRRNAKVEAARAEGGVVQEAEVWA